jgi:FAD:protein FMN transferase
MPTTTSRSLPPAARFRALGTTAVVAVTEVRARAGAIDILAEELDAIDRACSRFRADSELSRINAAPGTWADVSPLFLGALEVALDAARSTDGIVDPTIGRALRVLGYDRDFASVAANGAPLRVLVERAAGWRAVEVDGLRSRVRVPRGVELDLGATAKAFAADRAARRIAAETGVGVIVDLGGDCALAGPAPEAGWAIHVADRHDAPATAPGPTIALCEGGLATSGTTARTWTRGRRVLHHVIDPATGCSADTLWRTASAVGATCVAANVATTAAIVLGPEAPEWLAGRGLPARLVAVDGEVVTLGGWPADIPQPAAG